MRHAQYWVVYSVGIEAHPFRFSTYVAIVLAADCAIQQKFGPTFKRVDFNLGRISVLDPKQVCLIPPSPNPV